VAAGVSGGAAGTQMRGRAGVFVGVSVAGQLASLIEMLYSLATQRNAWQRSAAESTSSHFAMTATSAHRISPPPLFVPMYEVTPLKVCELEGVPSVLPFR